MLIEDCAGLVAGSIYGLKVGQAITAYEPGIRWRRSSFQDFPLS